MDKLKEFIRIVLYTGYIKNEKPINLLIVGRPESGKSSLIGRVVTNKGVLELTDISAWGIAKMVIPEIQRGIKVRHIIIPDFLVVLAKAKVTVERTFAFLNSLVEEGIVNIGTYLNRGIEFKKDKSISNIRVRCGVITAMTSQAYKMKKGVMNNYGFLSRFIVLRYEYSDSYLDKVFNDILVGNYLHTEIDKIKLPNKEVDVIYNNQEINDYMTRLMRSKVNAQGLDAYGIRLSIMSKTLLKAIALKNGRHEVTKEDFKEFLDYESLINYSGDGIVTID